MERSQKYLKSEINRLAFRADKLLNSGAFFEADSSAKCKLNNMIDKILRLSREL